MRCTAITKFVPGPHQSSLGTTGSACAPFCDESKFSAGDSFCNSTVFAPETSAESFDTEDEPNKGSGLILENFCRVSSIQ